MSTNTKKVDISKAQNWLNKHGHPNYKYLQSLVDKGDLSSINEIRAIAQDLDLNYSPNTPPQQLIDAILKAVEDSPQRYTP